MIRKWVQQATELGYLQRIPPQGITDTALQKAEASATMLAGPLPSPTLSYKALPLRDGEISRVPTQDFAD
jgi:hypothetical protein